MPTDRSDRRSRPPTPSRVRALLPGSAGGLLSPDLDEIGRRVVRLGVAITWVGLVGAGAGSLVLTEDVRSLSVLVVALVLLAGVNLLVARHDWSRAITDGTAPARAEAWALAFLVVATVNLAVAIPRPGAWLYFLVIAGFFALLLPAVRAVRVVGLSLLAAVGVEALVGVGPPVLVTSALGITLAAALAHGTGDMVGRVVAESRRRARLLGTVAQSAQTVAILDPDAVPHRVADAAMELGFDVVLVSERAGDHHRMVVERSRVGPVFGGESLPLGDLVREAVAARTPVVRDHYLEGPRPNPRLEARGIDAVVISPVIVDREVVALFVGGLQVPVLDRPRLEAFTLLGGLLSPALANARRFEREQAAVATLDELGRLKDDFISNVSHELRTPITVILGGLQTLQLYEDQMDATVRRDLVRRAVANAESLQSTLGSLLEFARVARDGPGSELAPVDLSRVTSASVDRLDSLLVDHDVRVRADDGAVVHATADQLDRVVDNLLLNAARHTPPGSLVDVRVVVAGTRVRVEVEDDGPGVAPEDVPRLTDRFFRGGPGTTRPSRGLGLGLALAQSILEAHGSSLDVWSRPGVGTRVAFELPTAGAATSEGRA